jgi:hypothetical protein
MRRARGRFAGAGASLPASSPGSPLAAGANGVSFMLGVPRGRRWCR